MNIGEKMILFYDTETTGFVHRQKSFDHEWQPHIVQLAAQLVTPDNETVMEFSVVVDPGIEKVGKERGVHIPSKVAEIHGIDDHKALDLGVPLRTAIGLFMFLYNRADLMVAHNQAFDIDIITIALTRLHGNLQAAPDKPQFCTMRNATDICQIPPTEKMVRAGRTHFKSPSLGECLKALFDEEFEGAHDAMNDVRACRRVFFELKSRNT